MNNHINKGIEEYVYKQVGIIVEKLFDDLKYNNINVEIEKNELSKNELYIYTNIYNTYKNNLINLKCNTIKKFGIIDNFDYIFAGIIEDVVKTKNENYN